jgi:hypothetical protein
MKWIMKITGRREELGSCRVSGMKFEELENTKKKAKKS